MVRQTCILAAAVLLCTIDPAIAQPKKKPGAYNNVVPGVVRDPAARIAQQDRSLHFKLRRHARKPAAETLAPYANRDQARRASRTGRLPRRARLTRHDGRKRGRT